MSQIELPAQTVTSSAAPDAKLGAVFTKRWVVDLILDLAGYDPDQDLTKDLALEPSVGHGAFLVPMVERLLASARIHGTPASELGSAIIAYDIDPEAVSIARAHVIGTLTRAGLAHGTASRLANAWVREGDFLLSAKALPSVRWVIGNPPYVRVENVDRDAMAKYRSGWPTMSGRADMYVGFLEAGLSRLMPDGRLAVICADRWMRNQYGAALRSIVEDHFAVEASIVMHEVDAFEDKVAAYPAISVLRRGEQAGALVCDARASFDAQAADRLRTTFMRGPAPVGTDPDYSISWTKGWFRGAGSWPDVDPIRLGILTELESRLPQLEETGAKVSVGVATGADEVFITKRAAKTEPERLLRVISAKEITSGQIQWSGHHLVNPWTTEGLAPLAEYPGMAAYLRRHASRLKARHVATKSPATWWRTIDRVDPTATAKPKLLIPDLKDRIFPVLDTGHYYPGHSLYYITSDTWDLEVLGGLLLSDLATMFVEAYSVRMANGYLRVSAQYLRRVRVPRPDDLSEALNEQLRSAFRNRDRAAANGHARVAYGLT
jgi:adenine-specific DNA-methyltransferase